MVAVLGKAAEVPRAGVKRLRPHSSGCCGGGTNMTMMSHDDAALPPVEALPTMLEDGVFNSPPSVSSRRRRMAAAAAAARAAGVSPSPAAAGSWMRPRLGSSVAGLASTSPPQMTLRDIRKVIK